MKKWLMPLVLGALLVFSTSAFANGNHNKNKHGNHHDDVDVTVINGQNQGQIQGQNQGQDQNQDQSQGQDQGQLQGQGQEQTQDNDQAQSLVIEDTREFHNTPTIVSPDMIQSRVDSKDYNIQSAGNLIYMKSTWNRYQLKKMLGDNYSLTSDVKRLMDYEGDKNDLNAEIDIILLVEPTKQYDFYGTIVVKGNEKDHTFDCLLKAALEALDMGANTLMVTGEGAGKMLKSFSWGIGFNTSTAKMSDSGDASSTVTGGLGVSSGQSQYKSAPWIQAFALYTYGR